MTRDNPGIPRFIHRREVVFIGQENGGIQNARFIAALFFQHGVNLRQRVGGLVKSIGVEVFHFLDDELRATLKVVKKGKKEEGEEEKKEEKKK